jgi:hypothetical protein
MYTEVYKDLCSAGLACEHEEPLLRNAEGDIIESEEDALYYVSCKNEHLTRKKHCW